MNLKSVRQINIPFLSNDENLSRIFTLLQGSESLPQILMVGGCVRNAILGYEIEDVDLATPLHPEQVCEILRNNGVSVIPTGLKHGTVTAVIDGNAYEITTLRKDKETDGRHAVVDFTQCWIEDAKRRDFTMNTLLMDLGGNVYDPLGQGIQDADARYIRFAGDPEQRIQEDYLRILRYFRFHALYGGEYDQSALEACQKYAGKISDLSRERITQEFFKIISSDKAYEILEIMFSCNILKDIEPARGDFDNFRHFCTFQSRYGLTSLSSRLFVFSGLNFEKLKHTEKYFLFPKVFLKDMQHINGSLSLRDLSCDSAVRESIYRFGRSMTAQTLMIELVQDRVMNGYASTALKMIQTWDIPNFPVSGQDLMAAGFKQGAELGKALYNLEERWIEGDFKASKEKILTNISVGFEK